MTNEESETMQLDNEPSRFGFVQLFGIFLVYKVYDLRCVSRALSALVSEAFPPALPLHFSIYLWEFLRRRIGVISWNSFRDLWSEEYVW